MEWPILCLVDQAGDLDFQFARLVQQASLYYEWRQYAGPVTKQMQLCKAHCINTFSSGIKIHTCHSDIIYWM